jgi:hypothetical protein
MADSGVTFIDLDDLSRARGPAAWPIAAFRAIGVGFALFVAALLWVMLIISVFGDVPDILAITIVAPVAFGPFVVLFFLLIGGVARWNAGVGTLAKPTDFTTAQLETAIAPFGITLRGLLAKVAAFAESRGKTVLPITTDRARRLRSLLSRLGGFAIMVGGILMTALSGDEVNIWPALIGITIGAALIADSRRTLQLDAGALLAADRRKLVLLLRSFRDEMLGAPQFIRTPVGDIALGRRFEQGIAGSLGAFGPLIAIGKPGEKLPQIGAARTYLADQEWQPAVIRWMNESLFIAMIAGATEWIHWELQRILELGHVRRLVILLPPQADDARWANIVKAFTGTRWDPALRQLETQSVILVQLRPDGGIIAIRKTASRILEDYQLAIALAVYEEFCR